MRAALLATMTEERLKLEAATKANEAAPEPPLIEGSSVAEENTSDTNDSTVKFAVSQRQTHEERYAALSAEQKDFYDTIATYAAAKAGSKCIKNQNYEEYKLGSKRIVRMRIKRGILQCEFLMINRDLHNYIGENKNSVKESATIIKVQNADMAQAVFGSIDLAFQLIEEERAYKKQLAKERRRQARMSQ